MAQWLQVLATVLEDSHSDLSTHIGWLVNACNSSFKGISHGLLASRGPSIHVVSTRICK